MMALYNGDELHVKLVESRGELKFECYKRDSVITGSFITKFYCVCLYEYVCAESAQHNEADFSFLNACAVTHNIVKGLNEYPIFLLKMEAGFSLYFQKRMFNYLRL